MLRFLIVFFTFYNLILFSQNNEYPQDYFQKPLDIPIFLSGNFGELRDNHFHSGLDCKTQQKEGFNVYASASGYVSRIKISQWGYGKAIYITHPNGYTTVYGHLQKFNDTIEKYVKNIQYQKENYEIEVFPQPNQLKVNKGEIIALSGNTGGSGGPHLHFEIRETDSQKPLNPLLFGIEIPDHVIPKVQYLFAYPLDTNAQVDQLDFPVQINLKKDSDDVYIADEVFASGKIGFAVNVYDQQDGDVNQNGVYSIKLKLDDKVLFYHKLDKFSFDESKYINLLIDYEYYMKNNSRLQKCFVEPYNKLSTYDKDLKGIIEVMDGENYNAEIEICDFAGNQTVIKIPITGKTAPIASPKKNNDTNYHVIPKESLIVSLDSVQILFPRYTFYNETDLKITQNSDGSVQIHEDLIPLSKNFTMGFDVSKLDKETQKHSYVAKVGKRGYLSYIPSELKDNKLIGKAKTLGKYIVKQDFKAPEITPVNFDNEKWISNEKVLQVKIKDYLSGIKSFKASINGKWILMEWNHNTGVLTYDFNDIKFTDTKYDFKLSVTDNAHNTKTYTATFYRANL